VSAGSERSSTCRHYRYAVSSQHTRNTHVHKTDTQSDYGHLLVHAADDYGHLLVHAASATTALCSMVRSK
jgi:hypothetical protein